MLLHQPEPVASESTFLGNLEFELPLELVVDLIELVEVEPSRLIDPVFYLVELQWI
jgi:hypothetical protein